MNFVADESCAAPVIRALREAGPDVIAIAEVSRAATDDQVLDRALTEDRVLITEDSDLANWFIVAVAPQQESFWSGFLATHDVPNPPPWLRP
jgi:predicted nuclease of predicted toxin-antitoxin system